VPDKPTSEQIHREAETLRQTAIKLMEHAAQETVIPKMSQEALSRNGGNNSVASQFFPEQVQEVRLHRL
jgi:hypothetical protein